MNITMSSSIAHLAMALSKFQSAIENVDKDKQAYGYKYADLSSCLEAIKAPLAKNGLSIIQPIQMLEDKHILETYLIHETGEWMKSCFCIETVAIKGSNTLQQLGAGITYARRYALCAMVGLTQEDNDAAMIKAKDSQVNKVKTSTVTPEKLTQSSEITQLMQLCKEHRLNIKDFAAHYKIDSKDPKSVSNAIENFDEFASIYTLHQQNMDKQTDSMREKII